MWRLAGAWPLALLALPATAHAQPTPGDVDREMRAYFAGELQHAAVFAGLGAGSGYLGGVLLARASDASRAAAVPVLVGGVVQLAVGLGLAAKTAGDVDERRQVIADAPSTFLADESERMNGVSTLFTVALSVEGGLLAAGIATAAAGAVEDSDLALGAGAGMAFEAATLLIHDMLARARGEAYRDELRRLRAGLSVRVEGVDVRLAVDF